MRLRLIALLMLLAFPAQAQIVNTLPFQLQNGTTADATQVMADFNQIVNNTNSNAARNGANADITSLSGLTTPLSPAQGGTTVYVGGTSVGTNSIVVSTVVPNSFTLAAGKRVVFIAGGNNSGATQLNVSGTGLVNLYNATPLGPLPMLGGEIRTGDIVEAVYDGTQYQLVTNNLSLLGPLTNLASAATTDLGTVATHNVNVTGAVGPITSFGSSAQTAYPIYYLTFASTPTITYNAVSMILPGAADIVVAAGDTAVVQYLGAGNWKVWSYQRASGATVVATTPLCGATGLIITNNAGTPNTSIDVSWDVTTLVNTSGVSVNNSTPTTVTLNSTLSGAVNQWDAARPTSAWGYIYLISNGTTFGALGSASTTTPTMPAGYTYKCLLGAMRFDGAQNLLRTRQVGRSLNYTPIGSGNSANYPLIDSGSGGTWSATATPMTAWKTESLTSFVPAIGNDITVMITNTQGNNVNTNISVSGNSSTGGVKGSNPAECTILPAVMSLAMMCHLSFTSSTQQIFYASDNAGGGVFAYSTTLKVNAN